MIEPYSLLLLPQLDPTEPKYRKAAETFFNRYLSGEIRHTDCGLAVPYHWGAATHGQNVGEMCNWWWWWWLVAARAWPSRTTGAPPPRPEHYEEKGGLADVGC